MNRASGHLCAHRLNWARRTSWGWWDDWDDTVLQTQDSKFEPWRSEAEHGTSRSRRLPTILTFTRGWGRNILFLSNRRDREPNSGVKGSGANHYPRAPAHDHKSNYWNLLTKVPSFPGVLFFWSTKCRPCRNYIPHILVIIMCVFSGYWNDNFWKKCLVDPT